MKNFLVISTVLVLACCFGGTLYAQAPCCQPNPACKKVCGSASADKNSGEASVAVAQASTGGKACTGQSARVATARQTGLVSAEAQPAGATAKTNCLPANCDLSKCDPTNCDWSKCLPPGCDPKNCDLSKCMPGKSASAGKAAKAVRL